MNAAIEVLVVEDSPTDLLLVEDALSSSRFHLQFGRCLEEALRLLAVERFDVVLLDLGLPDSQGLDTLRALRAASLQVAVVVLTGKNDEELALQALQEGAQDYLAKDELKANSLQRAIRYGVERSKSEKMLRQARDELETRVLERTTELETVNNELESFS